ncbi:MAG: vWA domain-containing protein [Candidatus Dormibacteria bacterium]
MPSPNPEPALLRHLVAFARELRQAGLAVGPADVPWGLQAAGVVGVASREDLRSALRATWCHRRSDYAVFDAVFLRAFAGSTAAPEPRGLPLLTVRVAAAVPGPAQEDGSGSSQERPPRGLASPDERLRQLDFGACSTEEMRDLERAVASLGARHPERPSRQLRANRRGHRIDWQRSQRSALRHQGEWVSLVHSRRRQRPRPLLVICDVSGSMERYSRVLVRFLHALERSTHSSEAFVFGTRLTRVTRELRQPDPGRALQAVGAAVDDWAGGTRIGECFQQLLSKWGHRALARGPVTIVLSDGWEVGDTTRLAAATARLQRASWRLIWCNPRMGDPQFQPSAAGMRAALPFLDRIVPVHNLESLDELSQLLQTGLLGRPVRRQFPIRPREAPDA